MSGTQRLEVTSDKFRRTEGSAKQHQAVGCGFKRLVTEPHATVRLDILQAVRGDASLIPKGRFGDIETQPCVACKV